MRLLLLLFCLSLFSGCAWKFKRITTPIFEIEDGYFGTERNPEREGNEYDEVN